LGSIFEAAQHGKMKATRGRIMQKFHERFKVPVDMEESRRRFINRALNIVFEKFLFDSFTTNERSYINLAVLTFLGDRASHTDIPLAELVGDKDYYRLLQAIEAFYEILTNPEHKDALSVIVTNIIEDSEIDLGIAWHKGHFHPGGAKFLDDGLVNDPLDWMRGHDLGAVVQPFEKALGHLMRARKQPELLGDVLTDAYEALEAMAKAVTGRDVDLSANHEAFVKKVRASEEYRRLLKEYVGYGCRFRHAPSESRPRPVASYSEVESFLYLTGVFIRLAMSGLD
jgi:hypothetical protein